MATEVRNIKKRNDHEFMCISYEPQCDGGDIYNSLSNIVNSANINNTNLNLLIISGTHGDEQGRFGYPCISFLYEDLSTFYTSFKNDFKTFTIFNAGNSSDRYIVNTINNNGFFNGERYHIIINAFCFSQRARSERSNNNLLARKAKRDPDDFFKSKSYKEFY